MNFIDWLKKNMPEAVAYNSRKALAKEAGIANYSGTTEQNMKLWEYLKGKKNSDGPRKVNPKDFKTEDQVTAFIKELGYIPDDLPMLVGGLINFESLGDIPFYSELKEQKQKEQSRAQKEYDDYYKKLMLTDNLTDLHSGVMTEEIFRKYLPMLSEEEQKRARYKWGYHSDAEREYAGSQQEAEDANYVEAMNRDYKRELGLKNFPLVIKNGYFRTGDYFWDDVKKYQKEHWLTDQDITNLMNSTNAEQKYAVEVDDWGKQERQRRDADGKQMEKAVADARNEFADKMLNALNAPSSLVYGTIDYFKNDKKYPNKSLKNYLETTPYRLFEEPVYASDIISTGNKWGDLVLDVAADPIAWGNYINIGKTALTNASKNTFNGAYKNLVSPPYKRVGNNYYSIYGPHSEATLVRAPNGKYASIGLDDSVSTLAMSPESRAVIGKAIQGKPNIRLFAPYNNNARLVSYLRKPDPEMIPLTQGVSVDPLAGSQVLLSKFPSMGTYTSGSDLNLEFPTYAPQHNVMEYRYKVDPEFEKAFSKARKEGKKTFIYKGKSYSTDVDDNYNKRSTNIAWDPTAGQGIGLHEVFTVGNPIKGTVIDGSQVIGTIPISGPGYTPGDADYGTPYTNAIPREQIKYDRKGGKLSYIDLF